MWFKNIFVYAFTRKFDVTQEQLEAALAEHTFTPCGSTETTRFGWVPSLGKLTSAMCHQSSGNMLICARKEEKILPSSVIKEMLDEKIAVITQEQGRSATKKEKEQIKEDIIFELLPRAFSKFNDTHAYINTEHNIIVINTSSRTKSEDVLALLRKSLGTLPVTSLSPDRAPDEIMTEWVTEQNLHEAFSIGDQIQLEALGDDSAITNCKNCDVNSEQIKAHLDAEQYVTKLSLTFDDAISFVIQDDLSIKRIKYFDVITEQNDDIDSDDIIARLDADFVLMAGELNRLIYNLTNEFGIDTKACLTE